MSRLFHGTAENKTGAQLYLLARLASENVAPRPKTIKSRLAPTTLREELSANDYEFVALLALGYGFREIGWRVGRTENAVKMVFKRIYEKTDAADQLEIATRFIWERQERTARI